MRIGGDVQVRHYAAEGINSRLKLLDHPAELTRGVFALPVLPQPSAQLGLQQRQPKRLQNLVVDNAGEMFRERGRGGESSAQHCARRKKVGKNGATRKRV